MDVFHKVLTRIYNDTGGKETAKADMGEILKQEGFFPSLEEITSHMVKEGWITEAGTKTQVFITHWGVAEAKKSLKNKPDTSRAVEKDSKQLISNAKQFVVVAEEFADEPSKSGIKLVEKHLADLGTLLNKIREELD
jgi:peroxiredoxin family protein